MTAGLSSSSNEGPNKNLGGSSSGDAAAPLEIGLVMPSKLELDALKRVFHWMDVNKDELIDAEDLAAVLNKLRYEQRDLRHTQRREIELMIWEVNDDLDGKVTWEEFVRMYQRCVADETGFEPRRLYLLASFLLYDKDFTGEITVESTLDVLYVLFGSEGMKEQIKMIFGIDDPESGGLGADGKELRINYNDYLSRQQARLLDMRSRGEYKSLEGSKKLFEMFSSKQLSTRIKAERQAARERLGYI